MSQEFQNIQNDINLIKKNEKHIYLNDVNVQMSVFGLFLFIINYLFFKDLPFFYPSLCLAIVSLFLLKKPLTKDHSFNYSLLAIFYMSNVVLININVNIYSLESTDLLMSTSKYLFPILSIVLGIVFLKKFLVGLKVFKPEGFYYNTPRNQYSLYDVYKGGNYFKYRNHFFIIIGLITEEKIVTFDQINLYKELVKKEFSQLTEYDFYLVPLYHSLIIYLKESGKELTELSDLDIDVIKIMNI